MPKGNPNPVPFEGYYKSKVQRRLEMVSGWARNGLSNQQIADNLGIGVSTLSDYVRDHEELAEAIDDGRMHAEVHVENAIFKRATGYQYEEVTRERIPIRDDRGKPTGEYEIRTTRKVKKQVVPDTNAATYWLEHRAPKRWEKNPTMGLDVEIINIKIQSIADLIRNPVPVRKIGSEMDD